MKIVISTVESNLGYVNIIRGNVYDGQLSPTSQGRQTLDRQIRKAEQMRIDEDRKRDEERRKLEDEENRKREAENARLEEKKKYEDMESMRKGAELADFNIEKGVKLIEEGLEIKRKAGYDNYYIDYNTGIINDVINGKLYSFPLDKVEDGEYRSTDEKTASDKTISDKTISDKTISDKSTSDKNEKMKKAEIGNNKIQEGAFLVKDAIAAKRRAGYTDVEINSNTKIKGSCINIRSYACPYREDECRVSDKKDKSGSDEKRYLFGIIPDVKLIHVVAMFLIIIVAIIIWLLVSQRIYDSRCIPDGNGSVCYFANVAINTMKYT
jgi:hypothetical protein